MPADHPAPAEPAAAAGATPLQIDFVSDVVCPWCAIGLNALEQALARIGPALPVTIRFQPFELNPQMGPEGEDIVQHLGRKYGIGAEQIKANAEAIRQRGAALGFSFGAQRTRTWNTFDAHRLLHWAGEVDAADGGQRQRALKHALLKAYHGEGRNPADPALLQGLAAEAGLDAAEAAAVLAEGRYATEVREAEAQWQGAGISSVPAVVIDQQYLISGGQPVEVFERALREIAARSGAGSASAATPSV